MKEYEYVIVGSGVAGSTLAKTLLEHDRSTSILMLEAGPEVPAKDRRSWWDYVVNDVQPYAYCYDQPGETASLGNTNWEFEGSRVMAYGGSTMHWGGWCLRFKPEDFRLKTNTGAGGDWPMTYDDLEPYYCRAEHHLSVCGDDSENWTPRSEPYPRPSFPWTAADGEMIESWLRLGIKPGKMPVARYRKCMTTGTCKYCPFGALFSGQYVNDDLRADPRHTGFEIVTGVPAVQILLDSKSKVRGIEYVDTATGDTKVAVGTRYVVASGAYESPKLLLRSTSSHWEHGIGNDHDQVGRYVVTHSILVVRGQNEANPEAWVQPYDFPTLMSRTYDTEEFQADGKIFLFKNRALPNVDIAGLMRSGKTRAEIDAIVRGPRLQEMQAFLEEKGYPDNQLKLAPGRNRFGLPKTTINFSRHQSTLENAQKRLDLLQAVIEDMGYRVVKRSLDDPGGHHTSGTCRMATTPEEGVTDADLRVFGMDNLWVCSNAVFPSGAAVNPTLTLTALSMRLGDHFIDSAADVQIQHLVRRYDALPAPTTAEDHEHNLAWLKEALQAAITLEYATCPPYLSALWSIENDIDPVAVSLREVAQEEMVHLALACNMLSAIGGRPAFTVPPPDAPLDLPLPAAVAYPAHLPGGVRQELVVPLQGLSDDAIEVFLEIESPEFPGDHAGVDSYRTIGEFYDAIMDAFERNADRLEVSTDNQITGPRANFIVTSIDDARRAIDLIKNQGEGSIAPVELGNGIHLGRPTWEHSPGHHYLAHYYRYSEMKERRKIRTWSEVRDGHDVTLYEFGDPFAWPTVFPMAKVPPGGYRADDVAPEVAFLLDKFDATYTRLLDLFEGAWRRGGQASFWHAIETMFDLAETGRELMQIPVPGTGEHYGPCFRYRR